ncbi:MAG TPA: hypothetical protein VLD13_00345 [Gaiellaceae bacterium]|nr:hypothetical protein [Gaiellaceae bacterium]
MLRRLEEAGHLRSRPATSASGPARTYYAVTQPVLERLAPARRC